MKILTTIFSSVVLLGASFFIIGCGGSGTKIGTTKATVRVVHASPDAPLVNILVNDILKKSGLAYSESDENTFLPGATNIKVKLTGSTTTVINSDLNLVANRLYTVLAVDNAATVSAIVVDDPNSGPGLGKVRLRVVHASPSAGPVDVYVTAPGAVLPVLPTLANVTFKSISDALMVDSGNYQVRITPAGTPGTVAIDSGTLALAGNSSVVAIALETAGGGGPFLAKFLIQKY